MQTSELLKVSREKILHEWEEEVRRDLPSAKHENRSALRDSLPQFIDQLASTLIQTKQGKKRELTTVAQRHGAERANLSSYSIEEALKEYDILRKVIFRILEQNGPLSQAERDTIYDAIYLGLASAGTEFSKTQLRNEEYARELANKRLQEKIRIEERFLLALEASEFGIWEYQHETQEIILTKEEARLYELPEDQEIYHVENLLAKIHPEDKNKVMKNLCSDVPSSESFTLDFRLLLSGGRTRWITTKGKAICNEQGRVIKNIGIDKDITDRKEDEHLLEKSTQKLRLITDIQPSLISFVDKDLKYRFVNDSYEKALKIKRRDLLGKHMKDSLGFRAWNEIKPYVERVLRGEDVTYEKVIHYDTGPRYIKAHYRPSFDESHNIEGFYVSVLDLTEQMNILQALRKSEEEFRTLSNAIPQLAWMAHPNGSIYWFNSRWYDYTGSSNDDSMGWRWQKFHHPEYLENAVNFYKEKVQEGKTWEDIFPLKGKNGQYRWFLSRAIPIRDQSGKILKWFGTNTDVTEQKKINDQLQKEQSLRDRLIYTLSHDLRTPLTAAKMAAQLIQRKSDHAEAVSKQSERIIKNINRADQMIQDLLDASRVKAGQLIKPDLHPFEAREALTSTVENLRTIYGDRFKVRGKEKIEVFSWAQGIMRIVENLCTNAVKYGASDKEIEITLDDEEDHFTFSVHNYGDPIENGLNVFEEFQRSDNAEQSSKRGWGIGLTIVKGITESLGGDVTFQRHEDGTTFTVILPKDSRNKTPTHLFNEKQH
ncbi:MAG: PAS domain-containing protein [Bacteriovoracia bacterium]